MRPSLKSLIMTILLLSYVFIYAMLVMALMNSNIKPTSKWGEGLAYAFAGIAWLPIAMLIIKQMVSDKK